MCQRCGNKTVIHTIDLLRRSLAATGEERENGLKDLLKYPPDCFSPECIDALLHILQTTAVEDLLSVNVKLVGPRLCGFGYHTGIYVAFLLGQLGDQRAIPVVRKVLTDVRAWQANPSRTVSDGKRHNPYLDQFVVPVEYDDAKHMATRMLNNSLADFARVAGEALARLQEPPQNSPSTPTSPTDLSQIGRRFPQPTLHTHAPVAGFFPGSDIGFTFDLPDGWRQDPDSGRTIALSFYGPNGGRAAAKEHIELVFAVIGTQYVIPESRERFLAEPGGTVLRTRVGDEDNVVVLQRNPPRVSEISIVRDRIHYLIRYSNDPATEAAIECLKQSAEFPTAEMAQSVIRRWTAGMSRYEPGPV